MSEDQIKVVRAVALCSLLSSLASFLLNKYLVILYNIDLRHALFMIVFVTINLFSLYISITDKEPPSAFYYFYLQYEKFNEFVKFNAAILLFYTAMTLSSIFLEQYTSG